ncbi:hypothetical protein BC832DRAFT_551694 [Gaertneriomyces semiglobifer]|nr:hypothetical protein BC832DRAFT_551694 [Gaertneriomyces semiglobifer]
MDDGGPDPDPVDSAAAHLDQVPEHHGPGILQGKAIPEFPTITFAHRKKLDEESDTLYAVDCDRRNEIGGFYFYEHDERLELDFSADLGWKPTRDVTGEQPTEHQARYPTGRLTVQPETQSLAKTVERMVRYHETRFFDAFVPRELLREHVREGLEVSKELDEYDPFAGNMLQICTFDSASKDQYLMFAGGSTFDELHFARAPTNDLSGMRYMNNAAVSCRNAILQLESCPTIHPSSSMLCATRTHGAVSFGKSTLVRTNEDLRVESCAIADLAFSQRPMGVAFSPAYVNEAAVVVDGGNLYLWDPETGAASLQRSGPAVSEESAYGLKWKSVRYAAHPRSLLVAHAQHLELVDLRSSQTPATLFTARRKERLHAFSTDPLNPFHSFLSSSTRHILLDIRYPDWPLHAWPVEIWEDSPAGCSIVHEYADNGSTAYLTWSHKRGEVLAFTANHGTPSALANSEQFSDVSPSFTKPPTFYARPCKFSDNASTPPLDTQLPLRGMTAVARADGQGIMTFRLTNDKTVCAHLYELPSARPPAEVFSSDSFELPGQRLGGQLAWTDNAASQDAGNSGGQLIKTHQVSDWQAIACYLDRVATDIANMPVHSQTHHAQSGNSVERLVKADGVKDNATLWEAVLSTSRPPVADDGRPLDVYSMYRRPLPPSAREIQEELDAYGQDVEEIDWLALKSWMHTASQRDDPTSRPLHEFILHDSLLGCYSRAKPARAFYRQNEDTKVDLLDTKNSSVKDESKAMGDFPSAHPTQSSTLHTPFLKEPITLSPAATALRDRFLEPEKHYRSASTEMDSLSRSSTPIPPAKRRRERPQSQTDGQLSFSFTPTDVSSARVPPVLSSSRTLSRFNLPSTSLSFSSPIDFCADQSQRLSRNQSFAEEDDTFLSQPDTPGASRWGYNQPSQSSAFGFSQNSINGFSQMSGISTSTQMSGKKKKARRKGF